MSPIGRILIVVNLVLAALFVGWAANALSSNGEFKAKYDKEVLAHTSLKTTLGDELAKAKADLQVSRDTANAARAAQDEASRDRDRIKADLDQEVARNAKFEADLNKIAATLGEIEASKAALQADKDRAVAARTEAEKAATAAQAAQTAAEGQLADLTGQLTTANNQIADLEQARTSLEKEKQSVDAQLATVVDQYDIKLSDIGAMPLIEGRVLDVNMNLKPGLVSLNVGEANNVKRGFTFEIYDGKTYKGQMKVEFVHPNMCSGVIVRTVQGQTIRQGDGAATRL